MQILAAALNAFSQGIAYFHAGMELLRSKSMDRNSFDSGDWFNRIDWTGRENFFGDGPATRARQRRELAADAAATGGPRLKPTPADIAVDARRIQRPAANPLEFDAVPPAHAPTTSSSACTS